MSYYSAIVTKFIVPIHSFTTDQWSIAEDEETNTCTIQHLLQPIFDKDVKSCTMEKVGFQQMMLGELGISM